MLGMFINKKAAIVIVLIVFLFSQNTKAQPPCPPFTDCWCKERPNHPRCKPTGVPVNQHLWLLISGGVLLGIWYHRNKNIKERV